MDERLQNASINGNVAGLAELMKEEEGRALLGQVTPGLCNTCLHICASYGHTHFAAEVLRLRPKLASVRNKQTETPLHIACREGKAQTARLLLESNPSLACSALVAAGDEKGANAMMLAARHGHVEVLKLLLSDRWLPLFRVEGSLVPSLLEAASRGHSVCLSCWSRYCSRDINGRTSCSDRRGRARVYCSASGCKQWSCASRKRTPED
ncbi:uncharacterized protein LOC116256773 isoform X2 [Nymphaea colorata]|uniref:uncharacterized protein LOC116256773 isoform X2 n=1 Tax=Nymphaea colorata TaxID=210225 RepID=UPI00129D45DC|nr:uncharacterized protein LOC116256773 isoform X2 [Nymphaea colorata]